MMPDLLDFLPTVTDFPKPGILFRDISPLLADAHAFASAIDGMQKLAADLPIDCVAGIESRGLIFAAALATRMRKGLVPVRKPGKLPPQTLRENYALEYGEDGLEIQRRSLSAGMRVLLVDDVIATGGTLLAAARLVPRLDAQVTCIVALLSLEALGGVDRLHAAGIEVRTLLRA